MLARAGLLDTTEDILVVNKVFHPDVTHGLTVH